MKKKIKKYSRRIFLICVETLAVIAILLAVMAGIAVWRLKSGPIDVGFARDYIQEALRDPERGAYASLEGAQLHWPDLSGPLLLNIKGGKIYNAESELLVSVESVDVSLSKSQLLIGNIAPIALLLKKPELRIIRSEQGVYVGLSEAEFSFEDSPDLEEQTNLTARILDYIARPDQNKRTSSPLSSLEQLEIKSAQVIVEDHILESSWSLPSADLSLERAKGGLKASFYSFLPGEDNRNSSIEASATVAWESKNVQLNAALINFDVDLLADTIPPLSFLSQQDAVVNADIEAVLDPNLKPMAVLISVDSPSGAIYVPEYRSAAVPYQNFFLEAAYDEKAKNLVIREAGLVVNEIPLKASADLSVTEEELSGFVRFEIDEVEQSRIASVWPEALVEDNSHDWVVEKLSKGTFSNLFADIDFRADFSGEEWRAEVDDINAGFVFTGMTVDYRSPLMPVEEGKGKGSYNHKEERLSITVESARVADLQVKGAQLEFVNIIEKGAGTADLSIPLSGSLKTALKYVERDPINVTQDFALEQVGGTADLKVNVRFPAVDNIQVEDVKVKVDGTLQDIHLPGIVRAMPLEGGPFTVSVAGNEFNMKGKGMVGRRDVELDYKEFLESEGQAYRNRVTATLTADQDFRESLGIDLSDFLTGPVPVTIIYTEYAGGASDASVNANLRPARLFISPFKYEKGPGVNGEATFNAVLKNGDISEIKNLQAAAPNFQVKNGRIFFKQAGGEAVLSHGNLPSFVVNETVAGLEFEVDQRGGYKIIFEGSVLDITPFLDNDEAEPQPDYNYPPLQISVSVDRMRTEEKQAVRQAKLYADIDQKGRYNQLEMDAIAGNGDIYLRYKPNQQGVRVFRFEADDAGATLRAFGVYNNIVGGKMIVYGEPIQGVSDRNLVGVSEITGFKVINAPTLAKLLNILSLPGIIGMLNNEGLTFEKLESKFDWVYRPGGSLLVLQEGRTSGSSVGFTFDGTFDQRAGTLDVSGTVVPLSGINSLIGSIPLVGDILTGGSGAIFAATYTIKGEAEDPEIFVNPLAVLAPGILRRILFE